VDRSATDDPKGGQNGEDGLPFPVAHFNDLAPIAVGTIENLSTRELQQPFHRMHPVASLYLTAAFRTRQRRKGTPEIQWSHIRNCPVGAELHEMLEMSVIGKKIEILHAPVVFLDGNMEITLGNLRLCTSFHEHPPILDVHPDRIHPYIK